MKSRTDLNSKEIIKIIFQQLGGIYQVNAMIGIKDFKILKNGLQFQIHCKGQVNFIRILLNDLDLFNLEFGNIKPDGYLQKSLFNNIHGKDLKNLIEKEIGLSLSL